VDLRLQLPQETSNRLRAASKDTGFREKDLVQRALLFYLDAIQRERELRRELRAWDRLSDEALIAFEESL